MFHRSILLSFVKSDGKKKSGKKLSDLCFGKRGSAETEPLITSVSLFVGFEINNIYQERLSSSAADINGDINDNSSESIPQVKDDDGISSSNSLLKKLQSKLIGKVM